MTAIPATLFTTGALALLLLYLTYRVISMRLTGKVSLGDGGNQTLLARSRAHGNFSEYVPIILVLMALIELSGRAGDLWLWIIGALTIVARSLHVVGMDLSGRGLSPNKPRAFGMVLTLTLILALALWAIWISLEAVL